MKIPLFTLASLLLLISSCCRSPLSPAHSEKNSVYYWKTVLDLDSTSLKFIDNHNIGRMYLRMFDVVEDLGGTPESMTAPNASVKVNWKEYYLFQDSLKDMEVVPVVYITLDALKRMRGYEGVLANNIVSRIKNMCSYNGLPNVAELQLDCDWTVSTETSFFKLCDSVKMIISDMGLPWRLSSTIRLHQLAREAPPVDNGVLMVYNTGSFDNPDAVNSILDVEDVKPYLKRLPAYPLHLDVAYPTYSWQLLFHKRKFCGLLNGLELNDSTTFRRIGQTQFIALKDIPYRETIIRKGDIIRHEISSSEEILKVKAMIETKLSGKPHSNILYHLDTDNLSNYTDNEINNMLSTDC